MERRNFLKFLSTLPLFGIVNPLNLFSEEPSIEPKQSEEDKIIEQIKESINSIIKLHGFPRYNSVGYINMLYDIEFYLEGVKRWYATIHSCSDVLIVNIKFPRSVEAVRIRFTQTHN